MHVKNSLMDSHTRHHPSISFSGPRPSFQKQIIKERKKETRLERCMHVGSVGPTGPFLSHRDFYIDVGPLLSQNLLGYLCLSPPKHSFFGTKSLVASVKLSLRRTFALRTKIFTPKDTEELDLIRVKHFHSRT